MARRPFAVFDIDGTIIRWQLYHAVADKLAKDGQVDFKQFEGVKDARMEWKKRAHAASFKDYEEMLVNIFTMALTNISVAQFQAASQEVIDEYKDQVYTYTRDLIKELKTQNYLIFAISASPEAIVKMLADYYRFDDFAGSKYQVKDGFYTGDRDVLLGNRKPEILKQLAAKHRADWQGSIAAGDSESDIPMLAAVDRPIAFNPTKELFNQAVQNDWPIVIERKNMVYQLDPQNGGYHLKL
jgi:HAD superfamily hydrolase (TIGR01490 family)